MVDGLEREFEDRARVLRADIQSEAGRAVADRYGVSTVPTYLVFDHSGEQVDDVRGGARPPVARLRRALIEGAG